MTIAISATHEAGWLVLHVDDDVYPRLRSILIYPQGYRAPVEARDGDIVIAIILGEGHTVKRWSTRGGTPQLIPESSNPIHQVRTIRDGDEWMIWGVVTGLIKRFR